MSQNKGKYLARICYFVFGKMYFKNYELKSDTEDEAIKESEKLAKKFSRGSYQIRRDNRRRR